MNLVSQQYTDGSAEVRLGLLRLFDRDLLDQIANIEIAMNPVSFNYRVVLRRKRDNEKIAFYVEFPLRNDGMKFALPLDEPSKAKLILFLS